jgi:hypothetical protein
MLAAWSTAGEPASGVLYGSGFAAIRFRAMELITILDSSHRFRRARGKKKAPPEGDS